MSNAEDISYEVMMIINQVRKDPPFLIKDLEDMSKHFKGLDFKPPGAKVILETQEGAEAVLDAVAFLRKAKPVNPLLKSKELCKAAQKWADELGSKGSGSHGSLSSRIEAALGKDAPGYRAENIAYGSKEPKDIVLQLIIDDGVKDRGHRKNLFSEMYEIIGVGYSTHKQMGAVCVIDFVGEGKRESTPSFSDNPYVLKDMMKAQQSANLSSKASKSPTVESSTKKSSGLKPGEIPESEWPDGYVSMKQKTEMSSKNGVKTTKVTYVFVMPDGEEITKINEVKEKGG